MKHHEKHIDHTEHEVVITHSELESILSNSLQDNVLIHAPMLPALKLTFPTDAAGDIYVKANWRE